MPTLEQTIEDIDNKSKQLQLLMPLKPQDQQKLDEKFRLEFNYNSNHMEGNTLTYGETKFLIIFGKTNGNHDIREYEEMTAHDVALKMIEEEAKDTERPLTENFIRLLNEKILVKPFWKDAITPDGQRTRKKIIPGQYKTSPNSVMLQNGETFEYTSPADTGLEMQKLVAWFNENGGKEHPLIIAALLHYRFVRIHPFDDGNGRVARLLMNYVLLKHQLPLIIIKSKEKPKYLYALNQADVGDIDAFTNYLGEELIWSLDISIKAAKRESIEESDDLDKKIEVLSKKIKNNGKQHQRNSPEVFKFLLNDSIIPLIDNLYSGIEKFLVFFERIDCRLRNNGSPVIYNDLSSFKLNLGTFTSDGSVLIHVINADFFLRGFKYDITKNYTPFGTLEINLEEYRYTIRSSDFFVNHYSYDYQLSEIDINGIVKVICDKLYEDIENKIRLSDNNS